jgi:single-strand DNA-binding protein
LAEKYLHKWSLVHLEEKLKIRSYDDKSSNRKYGKEIIAD